MRGSRCASAPSSPTGSPRRCCRPRSCRWTPYRAPAAARWTGPRTDVERTLAAIWAELLGVSPNVDDDFFQLGGHSLLVVRATTRVRQQLRRDVPIRALFDRPRLGDLAAVLEVTDPDADGLPPIAPVPRDAPLQLSYAQDRLWFLSRLAPGLSIYTIASARRLTSAIPRTLLERCLGELVRRHEALRTVFAGPGGRPVQVPRPAAPMVVVEVDLRDLPPAAVAGQAQQTMHEAANQPFDLATGPLLRVTLIREPNDRCVLLLIVHHIVADGWSMEILWRELAELCRSHRAGVEPRLSVHLERSAELVIALLASGRRVPGTCRSTRTTREPGWSRWSPTPARLRS